MIKSLQLKNFKPFREPDRIRFAPITLLYGKNSGGKSSLIQSLLLLKQTLSPNGSPVLITRGSQTDLGNFRSLVYRHDLENALQIALSFEPIFLNPRPPTPRISDEYVRSTGVSYMWQGGESDGSPLLDDVEYGLESGGQQHLRVSLRYEQSLGTEDEAEADVGFGDWRSQSRFSLRDSESRSSLAHFLVQLERERQERIERRGVRPQRLSTYPNESAEITDELAHEAVAHARAVERDGLPFRLLYSGDSMRLRQLRAPVFDVLSAMSYELLGLMESISYLGPLRSYPARHYVPVSIPEMSVGSDGENAPQILYRNQSSVNQLNHWFSQFDIPYRVEIERLGNKITGDIMAVVLHDTETRVAVSPTDVGFGIGQLLPILVEGLIANRKTICVEQPEIHLHPRLQAHLADFLIATAAIDSTLPLWQAPYHRRHMPANQWIVETHSETLMLRLQRRIREGRVRPQDVAVIYVEPAQNGARLQELRLDEGGRFIDEWPGGFFEEDFDERFGEEG